MRRQLPDLDATLALGRALGAVVQPGDVIALVGEIGAGKTTLVRGLALGAGADEDDVASPTFALAHQYRGRVVLTHVDLYRLERERELDEIGFDELLDDRDAVTLVEWADRFAHRLPRDHLRVELAHVGDARAVTVTATGPRSAARLAAWQHALG